MPHYQFETHQPVELYVEIGKGNVRIRCADTTESTVDVEGHEADEVIVEQRDNEIRVLEPRHGASLRDHTLHVEIVVPEHSNPTVRTGSADIQIEGPAGSGQLRSGSGDMLVDAIDDELYAETGSGDLKVGDVGGELRVKSGSGDVEVDEAGAAATVSTGSGDVRIDTTRDAAVVKTGSGDMRIGEAHADVNASTGSGDLVVERVLKGRVSAKGASGDISIGVASGVPVWTDVTSVTGRIASDLQGAGQPAEGQDHIELRATTVSGDITLSER